MTYLVTGTDDEINEVSYERGTIEEARAAVVDLTKRGFQLVGIKPLNETAPKRSSMAPE